MEGGDSRGNRRFAINALALRADPRRMRFGRIAINSTAARTLSPKASKPDLRDGLARCGSARTAFTYLELIITVAIVGIIAAIAAPRFARAQDDAALSAAARRVASELTAIRERAIVSRSAASVRFSIGNGQARISGIDTTDLGCAGGEIDIQASPYGAIFQSTKFASDTVTFNVYGTPAASGDIVIGRGPYQRVISVSKAGKISWK